MPSPRKPPMKRQPPSPSINGSPIILAPLDKRHDRKASPGTLLQLTCSSNGAKVQHAVDPVTLTCPIETHLAFKGCASSSRASKGDSVTTTSANQKRFLSKASKCKPKELQPPLYSAENTICYTNDVLMSSSKSISTISMGEYNQVDELQWAELDGVISSPANFETDDFIKVSVASMCLTSMFRRNSIL